MLTHEEIKARSLVERYAARRLTDADLDEFEVHLLECADCQREVRLGVTISASFRRRAGTRRWLIPAGLGIAAVVLLTWALGSRPSAELIAFGGVDAAPRFDAVEVRSDEVQRADSLFLHALEAYEDRRWGAAILLFIQAREAGFADPALGFLLGASYLMVGSVSAADREFGMVIATGAGPYADEARYYQAKTKLRQGDPRAALVLLRASAFPPAAPLADSVEALQAR